LRIMTYVCVGLLALFGILGYLDVAAVRDIQDQVLHERIALAYSIAQDLDKDFAFLASDVQLASRNLGASSGDYGTVAKGISESLKQHASSPFFEVSFVGIVNRQGQLLAGTTPEDGEILPPDTGKVRSSIEQDSPVILGSLRSAEAGERFAALIVPVRASWTDHERMVVVADTVGISGILPAIPGGDTGYSVEVVAADGRIIISTSRPEQVGSISSHYPDIRSNITTGKVGAGIYQAYGNHSAGREVVAITPLPSGPFFLLLTQPADLALAVAHKRWNEMLAIGGIGLGSMLAAAWYTTRKVVRPVEQLRATARAFAQGNLETPVKIAAQDELLELAGDVEIMRQQLKRSRDDIARTNSELEKKVAERTQRLQETLGKIITAQEGERQRLARELHDEQSQSLGAISVSLDRMSRLVGPSPGELKQEIEQARSTARSLLKDTRRLIYDLRPSVLDDMGLEAAIRWCAEAHLEQHGVQVTLKNSLGTARLPSAVEVALFRVAQEATVNIERHAGARHAGVTVERDGSRLKMQVWDDGKGFLPSDAGSNGRYQGVGLEGMCERIRLIGGVIKIVSAPEKGTVISVDIPLD